jgi:hypothetical protein
LFLQRRVYLVRSHKRLRFKVRVRCEWQVGINIKHFALSLFEGKLVQVVVDVANKHRRSKRRGYRKQRLWLWSSKVNKRRNIILVQAAVLAFLPVVKFNDLLQGLVGKGHFSCRYKFIRVGANSENALQLFYVISAPSSVRGPLRVPLQAFLLKTAKRCVQVVPATMQFLQYAFHGAHIFIVSLSLESQR